MRFVKRAGREGLASVIYFFVVFFYCCPAMRLYTPILSSHPGRFWQVWQWPRCHANIAAVRWNPGSRTEVVL